jgi:hypothetical protein
MNSNARKAGNTRCILLVTILVAMATVVPAQPALAQLPARPSLDSPTSDGPDGAQLVLLVQFPQDWPWESAHWQELWTVVQWQDPHTGLWYTVEGWQGTLDTVEVDEAGSVTGAKTWWVGIKDLSTGPFRWLVYHGPGGSLLTTSAAFDLPASAGATVTVAVTP